MVSSLRIGGLVPLTTVDYPRQLSAVVFCQGCPWRCRYCHNGHLLPSQSREEIPWPDVRAFLETRVGLLDAVVFSGGEPTLQSSLPATMEQVRAMGYKIGLHTAGPYPDRLRRALPFLDWVGLDIKALPKDYPSITRAQGSGEKAWDSLRLLLEADVELQVRTTLMPFWTREQDIQPLVDMLSAKGVNNHVLQHCRTETALDHSLTERRASSS